MVDMDKDFNVHLVDMKDYKETVEPKTWSIFLSLTKDMKERNIKAAFFTMTSIRQPDVHTRHSLLRLLHCLEVDIKW